MRKYIYWSIVSLAIIGSACTDVVEIDVEGSAGALVIDGWIDNRPQAQTIRLTQSQEYFDNTPPPIGDGAVVTVNNLTSGATYEFIDAESTGNYVWTPSSNTPQLGIVGDELSLSINYNSSIYSSSTIIKRVPTVDSLVQEFRENEVFLDDGIYMQFFARDFVGTGDAYWIKAYKNGNFLAEASDINIAFDAGFDSGSQVDGIIFITPIREFVNEKDEDGADQPWEVGESLTVEIHSLTTEAFNFLEITRDQITNGDNGIFTLPLANVRSNIVNGQGDRALGFFNVAAVSSDTHVVE